MKKLYYWILLLPMYYFILGYINDSERLMEIVTHYANEGYGILIFLSLIFIPNFVADFFSFALAYFTKVMIRKFKHEK